ncbi:hypothetical protein [Methanobacterium spitsbergense]|uniref:Transposase DDE domain-containing protein n=1 Tax=Methanobacterium spitsbergense TaxID=2874285 RepID=A0A8T5UUY9_9EURY|nr:hypothetical protein [Methanobacterium spitsbergense]MBZ2164469.1 hypothetical protein [Methanobacterium spitsbergense]
MSKYRNKYEIFCDAYGSYVSNRECNRCRLKSDCIRLKLPVNNQFKIGRRREQRIRLLTNDIKKYWECLEIS